MKRGMPFENMLDAQQQLAQVKRLGNELFRADFKTFQPVLSSAKCGHKHDRN